MAMGSSVEFYYHGDKCSGVLEGIDGSVYNISMPLVQNHLRVHKDMVLGPCVMDLAPRLPSSARRKEFLHCITFFAEKMWTIVDIVGDYFVLLNKDFQLYAFTKTLGGIVAHPSHLNIETRRSIGELRIELKTLKPCSLDDLRKYINIYEETGDDFCILALLPRALAADLRSSISLRPMHGGLKLLTECAAEHDLPPAEMSDIIGMSNCPDHWAHADKIMRKQSDRRIYGCEYRISGDYLSLTLHWNGISVQRGDYFSGALLDAISKPKRHMVRLVHHRLHESALNTLDGLHHWQCRIVMEMLKFEKTGDTGVFNRVTRNGVRWNSIAGMNVPASPRVHRGGINLSDSGLGKTYQIGGLIHRHPVRTLIICHKYLVVYWENVLYNHFGLSRDTCTVEAISILARHVDMSNYLDYGRLVVDDAHNVASQTNVHNFIITIPVSSTWLLSSPRRNINGRMALSMLRVYPFTATPNFPCNATRMKNGFRKLMFQLRREELVRRGFVPQQTLVNVEHREFKSHPAFRAHVSSSKMFLINVVPKAVSPAHYGGQRTSKQQNLDDMQKLFNIKPSAIDNIKATMKECQICRTDDPAHVTVMHCGNWHSICRACFNTISKVDNPKCPVCRCAFTTGTEVNNGGDSKEHIVHFRGKSFAVPRPIFDVINKPTECLMHIKRIAQRYDRVVVCGQKKIIFPVQKELGGTTSVVDALTALWSTYDPCNSGCVSKQIYFMNDYYLRFGMKVDRADCLIILKSQKSEALVDTFRHSNADVYKIDIIH